LIERGFYSKGCVSFRFGRSRELRRRNRWRPQVDCWERRERM